MVTKLGDRKKAVKQQIEFILDNAEDSVFEVILKAGGPSSQESEFNRTIAEALRKRSMAVSPRDVLPAAKETLDAGRRSDAKVAKTAAAKRLQATTLSLSAQIARSGIGATPIQTIKRECIAAMQPLLKSTIVQENLLLVGKRPKSRDFAVRTSPRTFWTSGGVLLRMQERDLRRLLSDDMPETLEGVYPNRRISIPPAIAPTQLPRPVKENKVSAWGLRTTGALGVWGAFEARGKGITIGLLDTGVDPNHPDLKGKIAAWAEFDSQGQEISTSKPHDSDKHGTHCAGTMVGGNASGRWIGMAPEAKIAAALVLNGAMGGTDAQVLAGIDWAIEQQVDVINMSLGGVVWGPEVPSTYTSAIHNALRVGIPVVTAIGNEGSQTSGSPGNDYLAFAVGALDNLSRAAGFSGGRTQVVSQSPFFPEDMLPLVYSKPDISAPGVAVWSSVPGNKWEYFNGTSMAAPHVSGAIALLLSATNIKDNVEPEERALVIQDLLTGAAEELGEAGQDHRFGFGKIDILRAIGYAKDLNY